ncbi:MAG: hypothetical protein OCD02_10240 [Spirochaetaceae bacterium]
MMDLNNKIDIEKYKEIQRRYTEKVTVIVNKGKEKERHEVVTDLPEPSFKEWKVSVINNDGLGNILISKCVYGESRSTIKKKLYSSESWTILCDCRNKGEFGLFCNHKKEIAQLNFNNIIGWNPVIQKYVDSCKNDIVDKNLIYLPTDITEPYIRYLKMNKLIGDVKTEEKSKIILDIGLLGFTSLPQFKNFILYFSLNKSLNKESDIKIEPADIHQYIKSPKFNNFIDLKQFVDMRLGQTIRFNILNEKLEKLENKLGVNIEEFETIKEIKLDFWNFGDDINKHYI